MNTIAHLIPLTVQTYMAAAVLFGFVVPAFLAGRD